MKKIMFLGIILVSVFAFSSVGQAAITTPAGSSETVANQGILPKSGATAVLGLNMVATAGETLAAVTVTFASVYGFTQGDLTDTTTTSPTTTDSGVTLYQDNGSITGEFDTGDTHITCNIAGWATVTLTLVDADAIPANDTGANLGDDWFVVIRTSDTISGEYYEGTGGDKRDKFTVQLITPTPSATTITDTITCESRVVDLTPMRSDTNSYTNASNTYYPGDYPGDSTYRFKHFVPYEMEDPDNDYYWYDGPLPPRASFYQCSPIPRS